MNDELFNMIRTHPCIEENDAETLAKLIVDVWCQYYGTATYENGILHLVTGGWSENEEIITALHGNGMFWSFSWAGEVRGGAYWFEIKRDFGRTPTIIFMTTAHRLELLALSRMTGEQIENELDEKEKEEYHKSMDWDE
jgi:hypothetical protein